MKNKLKRILAFALCVTMLANMLPPELAALAAEVAPPTQNEADNAADEVIVPHFTLAYDDFGDYYGYRIPVEEQIILYADGEEVELTPEQFAEVFTMTETVTEEKSGITYVTYEVEKPVVEGKTDPDFSIALRPMAGYGEDTAIFGDETKNIPATQYPLGEEELTLPIVSLSRYDLSGVIDPADSGVKAKDWAEKVLSVSVANGLEEISKSYAEENKLDEKTAAVTAKWVMEDAEHINLLKNDKKKDILPVLTFDESAIKGWEYALSLPSVLFCEITVDYADKTIEDTTVLVPVEASYALNAPVEGYTMTLDGEHALPETISGTAKNLHMLYKKVQPTEEPVEPADSEESEIMPLDNGEDDNSGNNDDSGNGGAADVVLPSFVPENPDQYNPRHYKVLWIGDGPVQRKYDGDNLKHIVAGTYGITFSTPNATFEREFTYPDYRFLLNEYGDNIDVNMTLEEEVQDSYTIVTATAYVPKNARKDGVPISPPEEGVGFKLIALPNKELDDAPFEEIHLATDYLPKSNQTYQEYYAEMLGLSSEEMAALEINAFVQRKDSVVGTTTSVSAAVQFPENDVFTDDYAIERHKADVGTFTISATLKDGTALNFKAEPEWFEKDGVITSSYLLTCEEYPVLVKDVEFEVTADERTSGKFNISITNLPQSVIIQGHRLAVDGDWKLTMEKNPEAEKQYYVSKLVSDNTYEMKVVEGYHRATEEVTVNINWQENPDYPINPTLVAKKLLLVGSYIDADGQEHKVEFESKPVVENPDEVNDQNVERRYGYTFDISTLSNFVDGTDGKREVKLIHDPETGLVGTSLTVSELPKYYFDADGNRYEMNWDIEVKEPPTDRYLLLYELAANKENGTNKTIELTPMREIEFFIDFNGGDLFHDFESYLVACGDNRSYAEGAEETQPSGEIKLMAGSAGGNGERIILGSFHKDKDDKPIFVPRKLENNNKFFTGSEHVPFHVGVSMEQVGEGNKCLYKVTISGVPTCDSQKDDLIYALTAGEHDFAASKNDYEELEKLHKDTSLAQYQKDKVIPVYQNTILMSGFDSDSTASKGVKGTYAGGTLELNLQGNTYFCFTKMWMQDGSKELPTSTSFELWRYTEGGFYQQASPVYDDQTKGQVTVSSNTSGHVGQDANAIAAAMNAAGKTNPYETVEAANQTGNEIVEHIFAENLPKYNAEGFRYNYIAREKMTNANGYRVKYGEWGHFDENGAFVVTTNPEDQFHEGWWENGTFRKGRRPGETVNGVYVPTDSFIYPGSCAVNVPESDIPVSYNKKWVAGDYQSRLADIALSDLDEEGTPYREGAEPLKNGNKVNVVVVLGLQSKYKNPTENDPEEKKNWADTDEFKRNNLPFISERMSMEYYSEPSRYDEKGRELEYRFVEKGVYYVPVNTNPTAEELVKQYVNHLDETTGVIRLPGICKDEDYFQSTTTESTNSGTIINALQGPTAYVAEKSWHYVDTTAVESSGYVGHDPAYLGVEVELRRVDVNGKDVPVKWVNEAPASDETNEDEPYILAENVVCQPQANPEYTDHQVKDGVYVPVPNESFYTNGVFDWDAYWKSICTENNNHAEDNYHFFIPTNTVGKFGTLTNDSAGKVGTGMVYGGDGLLTIKGLPRYDKTGGEYHYYVREITSKFSTSYSYNVPIDNANDGFFDSYENDTSKLNDSIYTSNITPQSFKEFNDERNNVHIVNGNVGDPVFYVKVRKVWLDGGDTENRKPTVMQLCVGDDSHPVGTKYKTEATGTDVTELVSEDEKAVRSNGIYQGTILLTEADNWWRELALFYPDDVLTQYRELKDKNPTKANTLLKNYRETFKIRELGVVDDYDSSNHNGTYYTVNNGYVKDGVSIGSPMSYQTMTTDVAEYEVFYQSQHEAEIPAAANENAENKLLHEHYFADAVSKGTRKDGVVVSQPVSGNETGSVNSFDGLITKTIVENNTLNSTNCTVEADSEGFYNVYNRRIGQIQVHTETRIYDGNIATLKEGATATANPADDELVSKLGDEQIRQIFQNRYNANIKYTIYAHFANETTEDQSKVMETTFINDSIHQNALVAEMDATMDNIPLEGKDGYYLKSSLSTYDSQDLNNQKGSGMTFPKYDKEGNVIRYTVTMTTGDADKSWADYEFVKNDGSGYVGYEVGPQHITDTVKYNFTLRRTATTSVYFNKEWRDEAQMKAKNRPDIYLNLYYWDYDAQKMVPLYVNSEWEKWNNTVGEYNRSGTDDYRSRCTMSGLPKYDEYGREIVYYAVEKKNGNPQNFDYAETEVEFPETQYHFTHPNGEDGTQPVANSIGIGEKNMPDEWTDGEVTYAKQRSTFVNKLDANVDVNGHKVWINLPRGFDIKDLPTIQFILQRRVKPEVIGRSDEGWNTVAIGNRFGESPAISFEYFFKVLGYNTQDGKHATDADMSEYTSAQQLVMNSGDENDLVNADAGEIVGAALPKYDPMGRVYEYRVEELFPEQSNEKEVEEVIRHIGNNSNTYTINNSFLHTKFINNQYNYNFLKVHKEWDVPKWVDRNENLPDVTFKLYRTYLRKDGKTYAKPELVDTKTLKMVDDERANEVVFGSEEELNQKLLVYAPNGRKYVYFVTEGSIAHFDSVGADKITFQTDGNIEALTDDTKGMKIVRDTLVSQEGPNVSNPFVFNASTTKPVEPTESQISFQNTYTTPQSDKVEYHALKRWNDLSNNRFTRPEVVELVLYREADAVTTEENMVSKAISPQKVATITVNVPWTHVVNSYQDGDKDNGRNMTPNVKIEYAEFEEPQGILASISAFFLQLFSAEEPSGEQTPANSVWPQSGTYPVQQPSEQYNAYMSYNSQQIGVALTYDRKNNPNDWVIDISNLDKYAPSGAEWRYSLRELEGNFPENKDNEAPWKDVYPAAANNADRYFSEVIVDKDGVSRHALTNNLATTKAQVNKQWENVANVEHPEVTFALQIYSGTAPHGMWTWAKNIWANAPITDFTRTIEPGTVDAYFDNLPAYAGRPNTKTYDVQQYRLAEIAIAGMPVKFYNRDNHSEELTYKQTKYSDTEMCVHQYVDAEKKLELPYNIQNNSETPTKNNVTFITNTLKKPFAELTIEKNFMGDQDDALRNRLRDNISWYADFAVEYSYQNGDNEETKTETLKDASKEKFKIRLRPYVEGKADIIEGTTKESGNFSYRFKDGVDAACKGYVYSCRKNDDGTDTYTVTLEKLPYYQAVQGKLYPITYSAKELVGSGTNRNEFAGNDKAFYYNGAYSASYSDAAVDTIKENNEDVTVYRYKTTVTNSLYPLDVTVKKKWVGDETSFRPDEVKLVLKRNGTDITSLYLNYLVLVGAITNTNDEKTWKLCTNEAQHSDYFWHQTVDGEWKYVFHNLPVNDPNGKPYEYTVEEAKAAPGYKNPVYSGKVSQDSGEVAITNTALEFKLNKVKEGEQTDASENNTELPENSEFVVIDGATVLKMEPVVRLELSGIVNTDYTAVWERDAEGNERVIVKKDEAVIYSNSQVKGNVTIKGLPQGKYGVKETLTPEGYETPVHNTYFDVLEIKSDALVGSDDFVNVNSDNKDTFDVKNYPIIVSFEKQDKQDRSKLAGAEFKLTGKFVNPDATELTWTSGEGEDAVWVLNNRLVSGEKYTITETKAPDGYILSNDKEKPTATFSVGEGGVITWKKNHAQIAVADAATNVAENTQNPVPIAITNQSITLSLKKQNDANAPLSGAEFELRDITTGKESGPVTLTIGTDGTISLVNDTVKLVYDHTYTLTETKAPKGYILPGTLNDEGKNTNPLTITFTIDKDGKIKTANSDYTVSTAAGKGEVTVAEAGITVNNLPIRLKIAKVSADAVVQAVPDNWKFTVKPVGNDTFADGTTAPIEIDKTNWENGLTAKLVAGSEYIISEVTEPNGFQLISGEQHFTVKTDGTIVLSGENVKLTETKLAGSEDFMDAYSYEGGAILTLTMKDEPIIIKMVKNGETATSKAVFSVKPADGSRFANGSTDAIDGITVENIENELKAKLYKGNSYVFTETSAPEGYEVTEFTIQVEDDGTIVSAPAVTSGFSGSVKIDGTNKDTLNVTDTRINMSLVKKDKSVANGGSVESDDYAVFTIHGNFADWGEKTYYVSNGTTFKDYTYPANAEKKSFTELNNHWIAGSETKNVYTITEVYAPNGYELHNTPVQFYFDAKGVVHVKDGGEYVSGDGEVMTFKNDPIVLTVNKLSSDGEKKLSGAKFALTDLADKDVSVTVTTSGTDGNVVLKRVVTEGDKTITLIYGHSYSLTETQPSDGYIKSEGLTLYFSIKDDGTLRQATVDSVQQLVSVVVNDGESTSGKAEFAVDSDVIEVTNYPIILKLYKYCSRTTTAIDDVTDAPLLKGYTFKLHDVVSNTDSVVNAGSDGILDLTAQVAVGKSYTLTETKAPAGYELLNGEIKFHVENNGTVVLENDGNPTTDYTTKNSDSNAVYLVTGKTAAGVINNMNVYDDPIIVSLEKQDVDGTVLADDLSAATFTVTGTFAKASGDIVDVTMKNVHEKLDGELIGGNSYVFTETNAPNGYEVTKFTITVNTDGTVQTVAPTTTGYSGGGAGDGETIIAKDKPITMTLEKWDAVAYTKIIGDRAVFTVEGDFADGENQTYYLSTGAETAYDGQNITSITDLDGKWLKNITYTLTEVYAPNGYMLNSEPVQFQFNEKGEMTFVNTPANTKAEITNDKETLVFKNQPMKLTIQKQSSDDTLTNRMADAVFTLTDTNLSVSVDIKTDANGTIVLDNIVTDYSDTNKKLTLIYGHKYTLVEKTAPAGFIKADMTVYFTLDSEGKLLQTTGNGTPKTENNKIITFADTKGNGGAEFTVGEKCITVTDKPVELNIKKVSADDAVTELNGWSFMVSGEFVNGATKTITPETNELYGQLIVGKVYTITEAKAPDGYQRIDTNETFQVEEDGTIQFGTYNAETKVFTPNTAPTNGNVMLAEDGSEQTPAYTYENTDTNSFLLTMKDDPITLEMVKNDVPDRVDAKFTVKPAVEGEKFADGTTTEIENVTPKDIKEQLKAKLVAGHSYIFTETKAPVGYELTQFKITVDEKGLITHKERIGQSEGYTGSVDSTVVNTDTITVTDTEIRLGLTKADTAGNDIEGGDYAIFKVTGGFVGEPEGVYYVSNDTTEGKKFTDETVDGQESKVKDVITFAALNSKWLANADGNTAASYTIKEVYAPKGYKLNSTEVTFYFDKFGKLYVVNDGGNGSSALAVGSNSGSDAHLTFYNKPIELSVLKISVDSTIGDDGKPTEPLAGARFKLTDKTEGFVSQPIYVTSQSDGTIEMNPVANGTSTEDGTVENAHLTMIYGHSYELTEVKAPDGYILPTTLTVNFTIQSDGTVTGSEVSTQNGYSAENGHAAVSNKTITVSNYPIELKVAKKSTADAEVDVPTNWAFKVKPVSGATLANRFTVADSEITVNNKNKNTALKGKLISGMEYTIEETIAPNGYKLNSEAYRFTVQSDGTISTTADDTAYSYLKDAVTLTMADEPITATLVKYLAGSDDVLAEENGGYTFTVTGNFADGTTSQNFNDLNTTETPLLIGGETYTVQETVVPNGYEGMKFEMTVDENGSLTVDKTAGYNGEVTVSETTITVVDAKTDIKLKKVIEGTQTSIIDTQNAITLTLKGKMMVDGVLRDNAEQEFTVDDADGGIRIGELIGGLEGKLLVTTDGTADADRNLYTITETPAKGYQAINDVTFYLNEMGEIVIVNNASSAAKVETSVGGEKNATLTITNTPNDPEIIGATLFIENEIGINFYVDFGGVESQTNEGNLINVPTGVDTDRIANEYEMRLFFLNKDNQYVKNENGSLYYETVAFNKNAYNFMTKDGERRPIYRFSYFGKAYNMADYVVAQLYYKDDAENTDAGKPVGGRTHGLKYSVAKYAKTILSTPRYPGYQGDNQTVDDTGGAINDDDEAKVRKLLVNLLNYGTASQFYAVDEDWGGSTPWRKAQTSNPANSILTDEMLENAYPEMTNAAQEVKDRGLLRDVAKSDLRDHALVVQKGSDNIGSGDGVLTVKGMSLTMNDGGSVSMKLHFNIADSSELKNSTIKIQTVDTSNKRMKHIYICRNRVDLGDSGYTVKTDDYTDEFWSHKWGEQTNHGDYVLSICSIPVYRWDDKLRFSFKVSRQTYSLEYSVLSYIYDMLSDDNTTDEQVNHLQTLLRSMYLYNEAAQPFFEKVERSDDDDKYWWSYQHAQDQRIVSDQ